MTSDRKEIGKIKSIHFGHGGYQDAMIGVSFTLGSDKGSWGVCDFWGSWAIERSDYCKWTEEDRVKQLGEMVMRINGLLADAKVETLNLLQGVAVECTFKDYNTLASWRILTEVI